MIIYPAIDLRSGKCVRLTQGDFDQQKTYSDEPLKVAQEFATAGASWIHVVDLDGAKARATVQLELIGRIASAVKANLQVGGGFRETADLKRAFTYKIKRVVVGSLCITNPDLVKSWLSEFGSELVALSLDCMLDEKKQPMVKTHGWIDSSQNSLWQVLDLFGDAARHLICTDISRDGMLAGPNLALYQEIIARYPHIKLQASGGISSAADLEKLKELDAAGAIVGKAIYEGKINLKEVLKKC